MASTELKVSAITLGGVAAMVGGIMWLTSESDEDLARKPALVDAVISNSLARCDLQAQFSQSSSYEDRLREALMKTESKSLDYVLEQGVTLCLDQRLGQAHEVAGTWDLSAHALYYPKEKVISLFDNGNDRDHAGMLETTAASYSHKAIDDFEYEYSETNIDRFNSVMIGRYIGGKTPHFSWDEDATDYAVIEKNSELLTPPLAGNDI